MIRIKDICIILCFVVCDNKEGIFQHNTIFHQLNEYVHARISNSNINLNYILKNNTMNWEMYDRK